MLLRSLIRATKVRNYIIGAGACAKSLSNESFACPFFNSQSVPALSSSIRPALVLLELVIWVCKRHQRSSNRLKLWRFPSRGQTLCQNVELLRQGRLIAQTPDQYTPQSYMQAPSRQASDLSHNDKERSHHLCRYCISKVPSQ